MSDENYLKQIWEEKLAKETPERREQILKNVKQWQEQDPNYEPHLDRSNVTHMPEYEDLWEAQKKLKDSKAKQKALEQLPMDQASRMARANAKFDPSKADSSDISSFVPKTAGEKAIGAAAKGLGYLDKGLTKLGHLGTAMDVAEGNIPEAALDVTETAVAKYGSAGAARVLPFLELLRPTEMEPKDDVTSDIPMKPERFRKLKQLYNKEE